jgi:hypothetical protein
MRTINVIRKFGLMKLAQGMSGTFSPEMLGQLVAAPGKALDVATMGTFSAPTPQEADTMNSYAQSSIVGGLTGGALGALLAGVTHRPVLPHFLTGLGAGALSGIARQYDQSSDPPGLSPVYTIPAGLRLGALTGAIAGVPLGKLTGAGYLPGLLTGLLSGATAGGSVSSFI